MSTANSTVDGNGSSSVVETEDGNQQSEKIITKKRKGFGFRLRHHHFHRNRHKKPWCYAERFQKWYEWIPAFIIVILFVDGFYELISTSIHIATYEDQRKLSDPWPDIFHAVPNYAFLCTFLVAQIILIITLTACSIWLKFLRNPEEFVFLYYLIVFEIMFHISAISYAIYLFCDKESMKTDIFEFVKENIHNKNYEVIFTSFQMNLQCCGIFNYKDWNKFNMGPKLNSTFIFIHQSCSTTKNQHFENSNSTSYNYNYNNYGLILKDLPRTRKEFGIFTNGCGDYLMKKYYQSLYVPYIAEGVILIFLIIILLYLIIIIFQVTYYKFLQNEEIVDLGAREQENDLELECVAGKVSDSTIADDEAVFYGP